MFLSVRAYNFRNLTDGTVDTDARNIYLVGENGQGKSNFLEMIYLLCFGSSFRTKQDRLLIKQNHDSMMAEGLFLDRSSVRNTVSFRLENGKKEIKQNGKPIQDRKDLIENIPCIVYKHEDIYFVNGTPDKRRLFFNQTMGIYDIPFLVTLREYGKIIKMRNVILKERKLDYLPVLDRQLIEKGTEIQNKRKQVTEEFGPLFSEVFRKVSGSGMDIRLSYTPSWGDDPGKVLEAERSRDLETGLTNSGPHRDRFTFCMSDRDFSRIASTGQSRLITLAMRNTQACFYSRKTGRKPVFLIDDVLLELDRKKRLRFIEELPEYEQAFFTYLPGEEIPTGQGSEKFYNVRSGMIDECKIL